MSDVSQSIARSMNVPEELIMRSARARAEASGSSVDDVLAAWSGGGSVVPAAPTIALEVEPAPVSADPGPVVASSPAAAPVPAPAAAPAAGTTLLLDEEEEEPIVAASLRDRLAFAVKLGASGGLMFGLVAALISTRVALARVSPVFEDEALRASSLAKPVDVALYVTVLTATFGAAIGVATATIPAWFDRGFTVRTGRRSLAIIGAAIGALIGMIGSGVLLGAGSTIEPVLAEDPVMVAMSPVASSILLVAVMVLAGMAVGSAVQVVALPAGLTSAEEEESDVIKHRLATSYLMPLLVVLSIAAFVLPFAWLLLTFHASAPLIAIVAAGGVLMFAGLAASRPNGAISASEFVVAALGIGTILLFVALVTNAMSGGGEHVEEAPADGHAVVQVWL